MINLALIGKNISHSKSPSLYKSMCEKISYKIINYKEEDCPPNLKEIFERENLLGLNITSPWKKAFSSQVIFKDSFSNSLNIINCVKKKEGKLVATNTDCLAIRKILKRFLKEKFEQIVLLGNGAMAEVLRAVFEELQTDLPLCQYFRAKNPDLESLDFSGLFPDKKTLVVNSCSTSFFFKGTLPRLSTFWDFNYNHEGHRSKIVNYVDGFEFLKIQATHSLNFFLES